MKPLTPKPSIVRALSKALCGRQWRQWDSCVVADLRPLLSSLYPQSKLVGERTRATSCRGSALRPLIASTHSENGPLSAGLTHARRGGVREGLLESWSFPREKDKEGSPDRTEQAPHSWARSGGSDPLLLSPCLPNESVSPLSVPHPISTTACLLPDCPPNHSLSLSEGLQCCSPT